MSSIVDCEWGIMNIINAGNRIMNVYVYQAPIGRVMIDTGYENGLKSVEKKLASFNVPMAEIKYVFLTHVHDDHAGFLNELLKKYP
jgi:glyoxylase-like metal-dependent hydrolase (beta-lactamase superfamily II)